MRRLFVALPLPTDSVVFILSNNHINSIITAPLDFGDEDIVSQYISFMKMLSLTINERTIRFFHNEVLIFPPLPLEKQEQPLPAVLDLRQVLRPSRGHGAHRRENHHLQLPSRWDPPP